MLYDALESRRKLWDSIQIQKDDDEVVRRKMGRLGALPESHAIKTQRKVAKRDLFSFIYLICQIGFVILFATTTQLQGSLNNYSLYGTPNRAENFYSLYIHIALLLFVGIGLVYSYMRKLSFTGIGGTLAISVFAMQWAILVQGFFHQAGGAVNIDGTKISLGAAVNWGNIQLDFPAVIWGLFGAIAVMVALGTILGKATSLQQLIVVLWMIPFWGVNYLIGNLLLEAVDMGGTVHTFFFGAVFGVALEIFMTKKSLRKGEGHHHDNSPRYDSDIFSILGTVFLWILWPSLNAAFAPDTTMYRVIVNTVLSLCVSTVMTFVFSRAFRGGKFMMLDVQRATISGGIGIGTCAAYLVNPGGAMAIGAVCGSLTSLSFIFFQNVIHRFIRLEDSIGSMSMFGVPGFIGGLAGVFSAAIVGQSDVIYGQPISDILPRGAKQAGYQFAALAIALIIAFISAAILAILLRFSARLPHHYTDENDWDTPADFETNYERVEESAQKDVKIGKK
eukprot:TRINITY_DN10332_c0_g1_i1.p1 TRINITY_DN10332_c0_g1~~TRINITY_DN10332_c0_g1_i1.p1  ORF type:complete len:527 (-),score=161.89 TRINITY_DN10332_c0_g1_i1:72-1586(-)